MKRVEMKLRKNGFAEDINKGRVTINNSKEVEIIVRDKDGFVNGRKTNSLQNKIGKLLVWGGYKTGYGSYILQSDYRSSRQWNIR